MPVKDTAALAEAGAQQFVNQAQLAITAHKRFSVALSGGSTPEAMHRLLTDPHYKAQVNWTKVHVFWGDERFVSPDAPDSNFRMGQESLLQHVPVPPQNIYPMPTVGLTPEEAAERYSQTLNDFFGAATPQFDLIFLGLGPDGHTASLFPGFPEVVTPGDRLVTIVKDAPKPPPVRLTLTYKAINGAANVIFLVSGSNKAEAVRATLQESRHVAKYPAQGIDPKQGHLLWILDHAAAQYL